MAWIYGTAHTYNGYPVCNGGRPSPVIMNSYLPFEAKLMRSVLIHFVPVVTKRSSPLLIRRKVDFLAQTSTKQSG